jgi:hypothetical protein
MQLLCASSAESGSAPGFNSAPKAQAPGHRVLLIGVSAFNWLRMLQERSPGPRIDMRYFIEGAVDLLRDDNSLTDEWMSLSRQALVDHVAGRGTTVRPRTGRLSPADGRTGRHALADGAQARTSRGPANPAHHEDCKALQVGEGAFQWLKAAQGTTRDPRLDIRYLVEGALSLLHERSALLPLVLARARRSLREHLAQLETIPIEPFPLEKP